MKVNNIELEIRGPKTSFKVPFNAGDNDSYHVAIDLMEFLLSPEAEWVRKECRTKTGGFEISGSVPSITNYDSRTNVDIDSDIDSKYYFTVEDGMHKYGHVIMHPRYIDTGRYARNEGILAVIVEVLGNGDIIVSGNTGLIWIPKKALESKAWTKEKQEDFSSGRDDPDGDGIRCPY